MNQYQARYNNIQGVALTSDPFDGICLDRTNIVKRAGYRSTLDQIEELTRAGERLQIAREEKYAKPTGLMPRQYGEIDQTVTDEKNKEMAQNFIIEVQAKKNAEAEQKQKAAEDAAKAEKPTSEEGGVT